MLEMPNSFSVRKRLPGGADLLRAVLEPLPAQTFLLFVAAGITAATIYCQFWCMVAFAPLKAMPMPLKASVAWAVALVPPWLIAFELGKRSEQFTRSAWQRRLAICAAFLLAASLSVVLELGLDTLTGTHHTRSLPMQLAAQIPMGMMVAVALFLRRVIPVEQSGGPVIFSSDLAELAALANCIEWIKAAGNYVEARQDGRTRIYRVTMQSLEQTLDPSRFVRIHRQVIVNTRFVDCRLGSGSRGSIRLKDGTIFKIGSRYDPNWSAATT